MTKLITIASSFIATIFVCMILWLPVIPTSTLLANSPAPRLITFIIFILAWFLIYDIIKYLKKDSGIGLGVGVAESYLIAVFAYEFYSEIKKIDTSNPIAFAIICLVFVGSSLIYGLVNHNYINRLKSMTVILAIISIVIYLFTSYILYTDYKFPHKWPLIISVAFFIVTTIITTFNRPKRIKSVGSTIIN